MEGLAHRVCVTPNKSEAYLRRVCDGRVSKKVLFQGYLVILIPVHRELKIIVFEYLVLKKYLCN